MTAPQTKSVKVSTLENKADWWRGAVIYQVYPRSYKDSNGDGIGDLAGVTSKLDYIKSLGVDAIWLSPFFKSPMADFGYDVSDYCDVDPMFGSLADFDTLIEEAHARGIRILIDLVLSHTSDQHPWFVESRSSKTNKKADWYVWADAKPDGTPPSNWLSIFGGSAWEWDTRRRQYYLHNFLTSQPDLNFHNPDVQEALLKVSRFWLERGVDGFRLDTVNFYVHDQQLRNNPPFPPELPTPTTPKSNPYSLQDHIYDKNRPENLAFLEKLRRLMDEFPNITSVGELGSDQDLYRLMAEYTEKGHRLHMAYSFELLGETHTAAHIRHSIEAMTAGIGSGWPSWALSNHDFKRVVSRWNAEADASAFAPMAVALVTSLRGTACVYQGEELGLAEADVPFELLQDPYGIRFWPEFKGRDGCRTPMPWVDNNGSAGFSPTDKMWLPVSADHRRLAVGAQEADPASVLNRVRQFLNWRQGFEALKTGDIQFLDQPEPILAFTRQSGSEKLLVVFNLEAGPAQVTLPSLGGITPLAGHGFTASLEGNSLRLPGRGVFFGKIG